MCPGGPSVSSVPVCPRPSGDGGALGQSVTVSYGTRNARQLRRASQCRGMLQHLTGIEQIGYRRPGVRGEPLSRQCGAWGCFPRTGDRPAFAQLVPGPQQLAGEGHAPCSVTQPTAGSAGATAAWRTARQWHGAYKSCHSCLCPWPAWPLPRGAGVRAELSACVHGPEAGHLSRPSQDGWKMAVSSGGFCQGTVSGWRCGRAAAVRVEGR